jgi:predicted AAA+ superfamily ATPase
MPLELPFHTRGCITPTNELAWDSMHQYTEILDDITVELQRDTPEFITILAPEQGGKTTFALQAISHFSRNAKQVLTLYLDLSFLAGTNDESDFVAGLPAALDDSLNKSDEAIEPTLRADLVKFLRISKPRNLDELRRILRELCDRLPNQVVLLICDELDKLNIAVRSSLLRFLRAIHATRKF